MKRILTATILILSSQSSWAQFNNAVTAFSGSVLLRSNLASGERPLATVPTGLARGSGLRTLADGKATIRFADESFAQMSPDSVLTVEKESPAEISLSLAAGRVWSTVSKRKERVYQIHTGNATAAVRGTRFGVEAVDGRRTVVEVYEGRVAVRGRIAGVAVGEEVLVAAGQRVEVTDGVPGPLETLESSGRAEPADAARRELEREVALQLGQELRQAGAVSAAVNALAQEAGGMLAAGPIARAAALPSLNAANAVAAGLDLSPQAAPLMPTDETQKLNIHLPELPH